MRILVRLVALLAAVSIFAGAACGESNPTEPSGLPLTGTWAGTVADSAAGLGVATLTVLQTSAGVSGMWTMVFANGTNSRAGSVSGTATGGSVSLFLTPSAPLICSPTVTLTGTLAGTAIVAGARMTGSYTILVCNGATGGTIDLTKKT